VWSSAETIRRAGRWRQRLGVPTVLVYGNQARFDDVQLWSFPIYAQGRLHLARLLVQGRESGRSEVTAWTQRIQCSSAHAGIKRCNMLKAAASAKRPGARAGPWRCRKSPSPRMMWPPFRPEASANSFHETPNADSIPVSCRFDVPRPGCPSRRRTYAGNAARDDAGNDPRHHAGHVAEPVTHSGQSAVIHSATETDHAPCSRRQ
jgi:hypothetical protein